MNQSVRYWYKHFVLAVAAILMIIHFYALIGQAQTVINDMIVTPCPDKAATGLPKTGQQKCYNASGAEIACSGGGLDGQDAYYANPAGPDIGYTRGNGSWANWNADGGRFTKASGSPPSSGTVIDNATGLEWVANPTDAGVGGTYTWANAISACEGLDYAGYQDWRLPNLIELMSIVDYSKYSPSIDTNFFTSQSDYYWSSTTLAALTSFAWYVNFSGGNSSYDGKSSAFYVRCVRRGQ